MVIHSSKLRPYYPKEGFELKLTKSKIPTLEKKPNQQVAPKKRGVEYHFVPKTKTFSSVSWVNENVVKASKKDSDALKYLMTKFPKISSSKITEGIFIGPQIRKLINDEEFIATLKEDEKKLGLNSSTLSNTF
ncbi:hypothetical protein LAZ67_X003599 [Cordylochernes scorpioides]|uniref:Uncharacterized protein n=1 Tax=Cordylochernes scorpioides TaxID=51811 RepID=A0ABY6LYE0_9ARAC|nr:hypothetical protein LAZ67_X003599 [Cordylochernes scorpioides]